jgi:hypothetical protein
LKWLAGLTAVVLLGMLLIGVSPSDYYSRNRVAWLADRAGLRFERAGIAVADAIDPLIDTHIPEFQPFSIEIAFKADSVQEDGFRFLFLLDAGDEGDQLVMAQWRSSLIIMNGNDYSNRRRKARLTVKSPAAASPVMQFVTLTSGPEGSRVYSNGRLMDEKKQLRLKIPRARNLRLVIGNSINGRNPWQGEIYGLALYNHALSGAEAAEHFFTFKKIERFSDPEATQPVMLYRLDEKAGGIANDAAGSMYPLRIPSRLKVLRPRFFFQTSFDFPFDRDALLGKDVLLNFFGFIPLGFLLAATLAKMGGRAKLLNVWLSLAGGFFISLWIETVQAWLPARSSDLRDLILNTLGALAGALCCRLLIRHAGGPTAEKRT